MNAVGSNAQQLCWSGVDLLTRDFGASLLLHGANHSYHVFGAQIGVMRLIEDRLSSFSAC
jgi:hypothetical protein